MNRCRFLEMEAEDEDGASEEDEGDDDGSSIGSFVRPDDEESEEGGEDGNEEDEEDGEETAEGGEGGVVVSKAELKRLASIEAMHVDRLKRKKERERLELLRDMDNLVRDTMGSDEELEWKSELGGVRRVSNSSKEKKRKTSKYEPRKYKRIIQSSDSEEDNCGDSVSVAAVVPSVLLSPLPVLPPETLPDLLPEPSPDSSTSLLPLAASLRPLRLPDPPPPLSSVQPRPALAPLFVGLLQPSASGSHPVLSMLPAPGVRGPSSHAKPRVRKLVVPEVRSREDSAHVQTMMDLKPKEVSVPVPAEPVSWALHRMMTTGGEVKKKVVTKSAPSRWNDAPPEDEYVRVSGELRYRFADGVHVHATGVDKREDLMRQRLEQAGRSTQLPSVRS